MIKRKITGETPEARSDKTKPRKEGEEREEKVEKSKKETGWLDGGQVAVKATILSAMRVMFEEKQQGLLEKIATRGKYGKHKVENVSKEELEKMNIWMRKSWSTRAQRLKMMPAELRERDLWKDSTQKALKLWVEENVGSRCEYHIL